MLLENWNPDTEFTWMGQDLGGVDHAFCQSGSLFSWCRTVGLGLGLELGLGLAIWIAIGPDSQFSFMGRNLARVELALGRSIDRDLQGVIFLRWI